MFLQAGNSVINTIGKEKKVFSLWEMVFSGEIIGNLFLVIIFLLGIAALYVFFEKYFFIERASAETPNLLEIIKDCIHEGRLEAAVDLSRETDSPEGRMTEKALLRIGRPLSDISLAMQNQGHIEIGNLKRKLPFLVLTAVLTPLLGLLGTVAEVIMILFKSSNASGELPSKFLITGIYNALPSLAMGILIGVTAYFLHYVLASKVERLTLRIQIHVNDFLDALNKPL